MTMLPGYEFKALLRCRFDFADNRPSWFSMWNDSGPNDCDKASFQNKTGLVRAAIEAKNRENRQVTIVAECDGHDFCNFEWIAMAVSPSIFAGGTQKIRSQNIGLALVTREERVCIFMDGQLRVEKRTEADKSFHFAGYGR